MVKRHLKRINAPKTWNIQRRGIVYISRGNPGSMEARLTMPIVNVLKYMLQLVKTVKEVKYLLKTEEILVNGKKVNDHEHPVCFTDILSLPKTNAHYRMLLGSDGMLCLVPISAEEASYKILKIIGKGFVKGKLQFRLMDGRNIFFEKPHYKVHDSLLIKLPEHIVKEHLKCEKGMLVLLYKGKHMGKIGTLEDIKGDIVTVKTGADVYETKKEYIMVVGKDKPEIKMTKK